MHYVIADKAYSLYLVSEEKWSFIIYLPLFLFHLTWVSSSPPIRTDHNNDLSPIWSVSAWANNNDKLFRYFYTDHKMFDRQIVLEITFLLRDKCILSGGLEGRSRPGPACSELNQDLQSPSWMSFSPIHRIFHEAIKLSVDTLLTLILNLYKTYQNKSYNTNNT